MDVRVLISQSLEGFRVCVLAPGPPCRSWLKVYDSKEESFDELEDFELAPPDEIAEARESDFDKRFAMMVIRSEVEPAALDEAGFIEQVKATVN